MPRIDRYIFSQLLTLFGFFALVLVSVYWINQAVGLFEDLMRDGQSALVVLEFTALTLPLVISVVLPIAAFAATAYGTNRLTSESEIVAMQAAGLSPWRLARPVFFFGIFVAILMSILVHILVPMARERLAERESEIAENVTARFLRPGSFQYPTDGITIFIREKARDGRLLDVFIEDARNPKDQTTYTSQEALALRTDTGPVLILLQGMAQNLKIEDGKSRLSITRFSEFSHNLGGIYGGNGGSGDDLRDYSTLRLLAPDQELLTATGKTAEQAKSQAHDRISQPLLSVAAAMLGFATLLIGGFSRFGVWRQVLGAIVLLLFVQLLTNAVSGRVAADAALWPMYYLPSLIGGVIVLFLLWLAAKPRRMKRKQIAEAS